MKIMKIGSGLVAAAVLLVQMPAAMAATVNGNLGVTAVVGAGCQVNNNNVQSGVVSFGTLNFGSINTIGSQHIDAQTAGAGSGSIVMECSDGTTFTIALDNGQHFTSGARSMVNSNNASMLLTYSLYQNTARTVAWSNSSPLSGTASGSPSTFHIYGRIPGGQSNISAGTYNDVVQVVISW